MSLQVVGFRFKTIVGRNFKIHETKPSKKTIYGMPIVDMTDGARYSGTFICETTFEVLTEHERNETVIVPSNAVGVTLDGDEIDLSRIRTHG